MRTRRIEVHPEAEAELDAARVWYQKRSPFAARRFLIEVDAAVMRAAENPLAGQTAFARYQKRVLEHFPFCVYYRILDDKIEVLAFAHDRRKPGYWLERK